MVLPGESGLDLNARCTLALGIATPPGSHDGRESAFHAACPIPMAMLSKVRRTLAHGRMLQTGEPVWVAVSGGVDSMVLLHVLLEIGHPCRVAHVDHGLRGEASTADRYFVEGEARRLGLAFRWVKVDVKEEEGRSVQMAARELRYGWFRELLREGPHVMALGHHRDDAVETLLLHLMRGMGVHGWGGIPPVTRLHEGRICRPLLDLDRAEILAYASGKGIHFREDASNTDPKYLRNRVRAELLPRMEELRPGARRSLARASRLLPELAALAEERLQRLAQELVTDEGGGVQRLALDKLMESPAPHLLLMHVLGMDRPHPDVIGQVLEAVAAGAVGARFQAGRRRLTVESGSLVIDQGAVGFPTFTIHEAQADGGSQGPFTWAACPPGEVDLAQGPATVWLDRSKLTFPLVLRPWKPGDRMRPVGLKGSKLVSDILTDARVPRTEKEAAYVLVSGGVLAWVAGHRVAQGFEAAGNTTQVLRITWRRP